jgi:hypothetical protein
MIIKRCQNKAKALELRLEKNNSSKYNVILAGMTTYMRTRCLSCICEGMTGDIAEIENETLQCLVFDEFTSAEEIYSGMRNSFIE